MVTTTRLLTAEDLERDGTPEGRWELINGELVEVSPTGEKHGRIATAIIIRLGTHVLSRDLGYILSSDTGFVISGNPYLVRAPDIAFVRAERLPADRDQSRFLRVPPDLVVEILSPSDQMGKVLAKVMLWLEAGAALVWLVDPASETVTVFGRDRVPHVLTSEQSLDGGEVLPDLQFPIRDIFAG